LRVDPGLASTALRRKVSIWSSPQLSHGVLTGGLIPDILDSEDPRGVDQIPLYSHVNTSS
jgi:hypothetical protein